jgi:hypothetical protein
MDAQLADDVDQPQKDYFDQIAQRMEPSSKIILCGPEPEWLYTLQHGNKSLGVVDNIAWSAINAKRDLQIPIVLSGDTHHYSRYSGSDGVTQFITSGGGGAFLHPTHQLEDTVVLDPSDPNKSWLGGRVLELSLKTAPASPHVNTEVAACYPNRSKSLELLKGNFGFVRLNPGFCILLGSIYWLAGNHNHEPSARLVAACSASIRSRFLGVYQATGREQQGRTIDLRCQRRGSFDGSHRCCAGV